MTQKEKDELIKQMKNADRVIKLIDKKGNFRAAIINNTQSAKTAQVNHQLHYAPAAFLAKLLAGASLFSSFLKGEERVQIDIDGNGLISKLFAEALEVGECRGFARYDETKIYDHDNSLTSFLGAGFLRITKILYNRNEPVSGIVELQKGDIATDLAYYFTQSEQVPTAVILDCKLDDDGNILKSGGILVQAMPGATIPEIKEVMKSLEDVSNFTDMIGEYSYQEIAKIVFPFEYDLIASTRVDFFCRCSKENFLSKLVTLNLNEIKDMKDKGDNELVCVYCNKHYYIENDEFDKLIDNIQARLN
jgi:molecular chaperone Hsp33